MTHRQNPKLNVPTWMVHIAQKLYRMVLFGLMD